MTLALTKKLQPAAVTLTLFCHNWRTYVRLALLPLIAIEIALVAAYLITNGLIKQENVAEIRQIADQELTRIVSQEAAIIGRDLHSVEQLTRLFRNQTVLAYRTPHDPGEAEKSRYRFTPGGAWYTAVDDGSAAAYYSALTPLGEAEKRKAWQLAQLDALMADMVDSNPLVAQIYLNTRDSYNRIFPFLDGSKQYGDRLNIPQFSFYYEADAAHNPMREAVWTEVYVDPAGQGWMTSCIAPVYLDDALEAVVGLDITVKTIVERILGLNIPWQGYGLLLDANGVIMAMPEVAERDFDLRELTDHQYTEAIEQDQFKPDAFNIAAHGPLKPLAERIVAAQSGRAMLPGPTNRLVSWTTVPQTGWKLLALVDEQALYARSDLVEGRFHRLGLYMAAALILFYLVFLTFLYRRARRESQIIADQLHAIELMAKAIGKGEYAQQPPQSHVREIRDTARQLVRMGLSLQHNIEARLARERELEEILETAQEGFWQIDNQTRTVRVNPALCAILGRPAEDLIGRDIYQFVDAPNRCIFQRQVAQRELGKKGDYEIALSRPDGSQVPCQFQVSPLLDEQGSKTGAFALVSDISARKAAEDVLRQAKEDAEAASRAKSEFLSAMSHEIRTPLNGVLGMVELMSGTGLSEQQRHYLDVIAGSGRHLLGIIEHILDFSKIEAGRLELDRQPFSLSALLGDIDNLFRATAMKKDITFTTRADPELADRFFEGDAHRIRQVLINLVDNAIKFTELGSVRLQVAEVAADADVEPIGFTVSDSGPGVPSDARDRIFEPFGQADSSTTRRFGGTGLGLPICCRLVELMGGELTLQSPPEGGARFHFALTLPPASVEPGPSKGLQPRILAPTERRHVLIAEDNPVNREVVKEMLTQLGFQASCVEDGMEAVTAMAELEVDLILMDLRMPRLDGMKATELIREREREQGRRRTPIVALTADVVQGVRESCLAAGMDAYVSKPVSLAKLAEVLVDWVSIDPGAVVGTPAADPESEPEPVLDPSALAQIRMMQRPGQPALLSRVVALYRDSAPKLLQSIREAVVDRDAEALHSAAHSLKSSSANLGGKRLAAMSKALEMIGQRGDLSRIDPSLEELEEEFACFLEALDEQLD